MKRLKKVALRSVVALAATLMVVTTAPLPANAAQDPYAPYRSAWVVCSARGGGVLPDLQGANLYISQVRFDTTKWQYMQSKYAFWNGQTGRYDIVSGWSPGSWIAPGNTDIPILVPTHFGPLDNLGVSRYYTVQVWFKWTLLDTATNRTTVYQAPVINAMNYNNSTPSAYCDTDRSVLITIGG